MMLSPVRNMLQFLWYSEEKMSGTMESVSLAYLNTMLCWWRGHRSEALRM